MEVTLPVFAAFEITKGVKLWLNLEDGNIGVAIFDTTIDKYKTIYLGPPPSEHGAPSLFWNQTMLDAGIKKVIAFHNLDSTMVFYSLVMCEFYKVCETKKISHSDLNSHGKGCLVELWL